MPEDVAINSLEAMCLNIAQTMERIDNVPYAIACLKMPHNLVKWRGNSIDGKIPLPQVILDRFSSKPRNVEDNFTSLFFLAPWQRHNNTTGLIVHMNVVPPQRIGQPPGRRRPIPGRGNI